MVFFQFLSKWNNIVNPFHYMYIIFGVFKKINLIIKGVGGKSR